MQEDQGHIIQALKKADKQMQKDIYSKYAPLFMAISKRYVKVHADAEDVCIEAFYKIFTKIDGFNGNGSFEGWMKRIVVNESLMFLRKNKNFNVSIENSNIDVKYEVDLDSDMDYQELLKILNLLPVGYRTVFNLYVIEGYKHREIAEELGISINTSKSQLILARKRLQGIIKKKQKHKSA